MQTQTEDKTESVLPPLKQHILDAIADIAATVKPAVAAIEGDMMLTKNHYGAYMALIGKMADNTPKAHMFGLALIKAGANRQGVKDALMVLGHV